MRNQKRAFTLIELLVVVAIIVTLISILMPSLNNARNQAKSVKCMSNLRQQGLAIVMYSQENNGTIPISLMSWDTTLTAAQKSAIGWQVNPYNIRLMPYLNIVDPNTIPGMTTRQWRVAVSSGPFLCPAKLDYNVDGADDYFRMSYAMSTFSFDERDRLISGNGTDYWILYQKYNTLRPTQMVLSDARLGLSGVRNSDYLYSVTQGWYYPHHKNGHNMLFPGGDVQYVPLRGASWGLQYSR